MTKSTLVSLTGLIVVGGCCTRQAEDPPAMLTPNIDPAIRQLEEHFAELQQQQPMNRTSANIGFLYDAKLYMACQRHMATLTTAERWRFCEEQQKWSDRRASLSHAAYAEYEGGTMASLTGSLKWIELTKARLAELERASGGH